MHIHIKRNFSPEKKGCENGKLTINLMKISPSMLACDFSQMGKEIQKIKNADMVHMDVMDGNFVPNISFGADIIKSLRAKSNLPFDTHLMINDPLKYIKSFANAGSDIITFHIESKSNTLDTIYEIKKYGKKVGLSLKPDTKPEALIPFLNQIDLVLIMTVEPGFGGQKFMENQMEKACFIKKHSQNKNLLIEVDGGINFETIETVKKYPVDICVSGTCIFSSKDPEKTIEKLKK